MQNVFLIPILKDNYVFVITDLEKRTCLIVDPGQAAPVLEFLQTQKLQPLGILLTHHHWDHVNGVRDLQRAYENISPLKVFAPAREKADIPYADHYLLAGDMLPLMGLKFKVFDLPGHTLGHVGYYCAEKDWLFSGDVLFSLGCGRIFEGTMEQHFESLQKIKALPANTTVFCTHEYTETNLRFWLSQPGLSKEDTFAFEAFAEKVQALRAAGQPTVPFLLQQELKLNPFLRTFDLQTFRRWRELRNQF